MKRTFIYIVLGVLFFASTNVFGQEKYTDKEIGFDKDKLTEKLEKKGYGIIEIGNILKDERDIFLKVYEESKMFTKEYQSKYSNKNQRLASCILNIPQAEKQALIALYNSTSGANWSNNSGWFDFNECNWYGVTIENNHVVSLTFFNNNLTGTIPSEIGNLTSLKFLSFERNSLSGTISNISSIGSSLEFLNFTDNDLTGTIPSSLSNLTSLEHLYFSHNQFSGNIPSSLGSLNNLIRILFLNNNLEGNIPSSLGNLQNLRYLYFNSNNLEGNIPLSLGNLTALLQLYFSSNELNGQIPPSFSNLTNLEFLYLSYNQLNGTLPSGFGNFNNLKTLSMHFNDFEGDIPDFSSFQFLTRLTFRGNKFQFIDFESEFPTYYSNLDNNKFNYSPQDLMDAEETFTAIAGSSKELIMFTDDDFSLNNTYQWYKGIYPSGVEIPGAINRVYNISDVSLSDAGDYYCLANNTIINGLTLQRRPIHLEIEEGCTQEITDINLGQCIYYKNGNSKSQPPAQGSFCVGENYCFGYNDNYSGNYNDNISFLWTFYDTDGVTVLHTENIPFPNYAFPNGGLHNVTLEITYADGCTAEYTEAIVIEDCDPCDTVAILVDESGSLDEDEIDDIRTGLSRFINDQLDSGLNISIIGMSDSDGREGIDPAGNIRTDHIIREKVTSATKPMFDQWINSFGERNGEPGISGSSDYWASALTIVNNSDHTPELVVVLTDGSQTADIDYLQEQINLVRANSNLYVYGIDDEYYVNSDNVTARLSRDQDPNYTTIDRSQTITFNNSSAREVVASLRTSLDYLFGTTNQDEPISGQENLINADYYGYEDFTGLTGLYGTELGILSNLLAHSGIECTTTIDECYACYTFQPEPGNNYWLSGWVKEDLNIQVKTYENASLRLHFIDASDAIITSEILYPSGNIIDDWQRIAGQFTIPDNTVTLDLELVNSSENIPIYFDDIRVHPVNGSMKSFVYDPITYRLMAELDENNYGTYYEYDNEGGLVRVKKETSRGVKTIQETRSGNVINNDN